jgi:hypothetical protein
MVIKAGAGVECPGSFSEHDDNRIELRSFLRKHARSHGSQALEIFRHSQKRLFDRTREGQVLSFA